MSVSGAPHQPVGEKELSEYEQKRKKRIEENNAKLRDLGLIPNQPPNQPEPTARKGAKGAKRATRADKTNEPSYAGNLRNRDELKKKKRVLLEYTDSPTLQKKVKSKAAASSSSNASLAMTSFTILRGTISEHFHPATRLDLLWSARLRLLFFSCRTWVIGCASHIGMLPLDVILHIEWLAQTSESALMAKKTTTTSASARGPKKNCSACQISFAHYCLHQLTVPIANHTKCIVLLSAGQPNFQLQISDEANRRRTHLGMYRDKDTARLAYEYHHRFKRWRINENRAASPAAAPPPTGPPEEPCPWDLTQKEGLLAFMRCLAEGDTGATFLRSLLLDDGAN